MIRGARLSAPLDLNEECVDENANGEDHLNNSHEIDNVFSQEDKPVRVTILSNKKIIDCYPVI